MLILDCIDCKYDEILYRYAWKIKQENLDKKWNLNYTKHAEHNNVIWYRDLYSSLFLVHIVYTRF